MKKLITSKYIVSTSFLFILFLLPTLSHAQPPVFGGGDDVLDVPVDGGLSVLIAAGIGYGAKRIREKRKK